MSKASEIFKTNTQIGHIKIDSMTKLDTDSLIDKTLTIIDYDIIDVENGEKPYCLMIFKELPNAYYFGGMILTKCLEAINEDEEAHKDLLANGVKIKLSKKKSTTKGRSDYTTVEIVD